MHGLTRLTAEQQDFLARTVARNKSLFGGFTMEVGANSAGETDPPAGGASTDPAAGDKGFPASTPVSEMTPEQQVAYWKDKARIHEGRNTELLGITGGKYGDDLKALLDERETLLDSQRTESEKAVEAARKQAVDEVRRELGPSSVRAAFDLLLGDLPEQERNDQIDMLDLGKFLTQTGEVDTAKVRSFANRIAPADKGQGGSNDPDYGGGRRNNGSTSAGVAAGRQLYAASRNTNNKPS